MNMHTDFAASTATTSFRVTLKGMPEVKKSQNRDRVIEAIPNMLISAFGVSTLTARVIAPMVYDGFTVAYGVAPANVEFIRSALKLPKGREALDALLAKYGPVKVPQVAVVEDAPVTTATPARVAPTANEKLSAKIEADLNERLMAAVKKGEQDGIDKVLTGLVALCKAAGQDYFVTQFANWTKVSGILIGRLRALNLSFGLYWTEGGIGSEVLPKPASKEAEVQVAKATGVPADELERLTEVLRSAVRVDSFTDIDRALTDILTTCRKHGVSMFQTPYANHTRTAGLLIGRLLKMGEKFALKWTEGGLDGEAQPVLETAPKKVKPSRAEIDARKAANRAERLKLQPAKGGSGTKGK